MLKPWERDTHELWSDPECTCQSCGIADMNYHKVTCAKRRAYEYRCMITHDYYKAGWNDALAAIQKENEQ